MHPTLGFLVVLVLHLPLILYIQLVPKMHSIVARLFEPPVRNSSEFDFVIVGAGSAGSVVAGRLAENGHQVLLIEAGGPQTYLQAIPALCALFQKSPYDWQYQAVRQKHAPLKALQNGVSNWPRGKVLGGSSVLNYMKYVRGHKNDFNEWASLGADGWSYDEVLPYFKKSQRFHDGQGFNPEYQSDTGQLGVRTLPDVSCEGSKIIEASLADLSGLKQGDYNGEEQNVWYRSQFSQNSGHRADAYTSFAAPFVGKGVTVLTHAHATKISFDGKTARSVKVDRFGEELEYFASKEVIVSAGTIGSPQLLMLSGIGPKEHLKEVGIENVILDRPGVGKNLQDHLMTVFEISTNGNQPHKIGLDPLFAVKPWNYWTFYTQRLFQGPMADSGIGSGAFLHTPIKGNDTWKRPDIQMHTLPVLVLADYGALYVQNLGLSDEHLKLYGDHIGEDGVTLLPTLLRPKSRGEITLASTNPHDSPVIDPHYLEEAEDVKTLVESLKICKDLSESRHFKKAGMSHFKSPHCSSHELWSDDYYECVVKHVSLTVYHPVGTCKMGRVNDPLAVVDPKLRLIGLNKIRIIDASVMPKIVGGNTNAAAIMIGEKGSDMILKEYGRGDAKNEPSKDEL